MTICYEPLLCTSVSAAKTARIAIDRNGSGLVVGTKLGTKKRSLASTFPCMDTITRPVWVFKSRIDAPATAGGEIECALQPGEAVQAGILLAFGRLQ